MDQESQKIFDRIVRTEPGALSKGDVDFLKARRSYLTASDAARYAEVLATAPDEEAEVPKKKAK